MILTESLQEFGTVNLKKLQCLLVKKEADLFLLVNPASLSLVVKSLRPQLI